MNANLIVQPPVKPGKPRPESPFCHWPLPEQTKRVLDALRLIEFRRGGIGPHPTTAQTARAAGVPLLVAKAELKALAARPSGYGIFDEIFQREEDGCWEIYRELFEEYFLNLIGAASFEVLSPWDFENDLAWDSEPFTDEEVFEAFAKLDGRSKQVDEEVAAMERSEA